MLSWVIGDYYGSFLPYINSFVFYYLALFIGLNYSLKDCQIRILRKILLFVFAFASIQIIAINTGFITVSGYETEGAETRSGVARAVTSLGDTNNGAVALYLLGVILIHLSRGSRFLWLYILMWITASALLITKSIALAEFLLGIGILFYFVRQRRVSYKQKIKVVATIIVSTVILFYIGVLIHL